jgi:chromosome segregation ATPase
MLRKLILVAVVGGLAFAAVKGTKWMSYVRSEWRSIQESAENAVPPEREIERLRSEVGNLDEDTLKLVKHLARLQSDQADILKREKDLTARKSEVSQTLSTQEQAVRTAEDRTKAGESNVLVTFGKQEFSLAVAKIRLKESVREYTDIEKELDRVRAKVVAQQRIIDKLEKQRHAMGTLKHDLEMAITDLENQLAELKLERMQASYDVEGRYQHDESRVAQIKESIAKLQKRFDVERRELTLLQEPESTPATPSESVDEIMAPVNKPKGD